MVKICNLAQTVDTMKQKPYPLITHIRHKVHMGLEAVQVFFFFVKSKLIEAWSFFFTECTAGHGVQEATVTAGFDHSQRPPESEDQWGGQEGAQGQG